MTQVKFTVRWKTNIVYFKNINKLTRNKFRATLYTVEVGVTGITVKSVHNQVKIFACNRVSSIEFIYRTYFENSIHRIFFQRGVWTVEEVNVDLNGLNQHLGCQFQALVNLSPGNIMELPLTRQINELLSKNLLELLLYKCCLLEISTQRSK